MALTMSRWQVKPVYTPEYVELLNATELLLLVLSILSMRAHEATQTTQHLKLRNDDEILRSGERSTVLSGKFDVFLIRISCWAKKKNLAWKVQTHNKFKIIWRIERKFSNSRRSSWNYFRFFFLSRLLPSVLRFRIKFWFEFHCREFWARLQEFLNDLHHLVENNATYD